MSELTDLGPEFVACMKLMAIATGDTLERIPPLTHEEHRAIARELMRLTEIAGKCTCGANPA